MGKLNETNSTIVVFHNSTISKFISQTIWKEKGT